MKSTYLVVISVGFVQLVYILANKNMLQSKLCVNKEEALDPGVTFYSL